VQQAPDTRTVAGGNNLSREIAVNPVESTAIAAALIENANEVDHRIASNKLMSQHFDIVRVALHEIDTGQHQQAFAVFPVAGQYTHLVPGVCPACGEMAADKT
jgi:hypothetical protein